MLRALGVGFSQPDMHTLAHRGYLIGPDPRRENELGALQECLALGFGIETDIRRSARGELYISHDACEPRPEQLAVHYAAAFRQARAPIALNIKELGYERELISFLVEQRLLEQVFLFDMELIEAHAGETARTLRALHPSVRLAARVSDRNESIERALSIEQATLIWLDEYEGPWATAQTVTRLKAAGRSVYAVSPELHGSGKADALARCREFRAWGVDGICSDWPRDLQTQ